MGSGTVMPEPLLDIRPCPQCYGTGQAERITNHKGPWLGGISLNVGFKL